MTEAAPPQRPAAWHWLVVWALVALQCLTALGMAGTPDTLRDLYFAQQLARGVQWPLDGPVIYNTLHLGPLWYYLLGTAYWLAPLPLTVPAVIAFLGALKFPLAYLCGRRLADAQLGLLFALAMFVPGWGLFGLAAMTHTTAVEAAVLFGLWCCLRYRERPGWPRALLLGVATTLMFHAHPTTLLIGMLLVLYAIAAVDKWTGRIRDLCLVAAVGALSLAPMLLAQIQGGYGDLATLQGYAARDPAVPTFARLGSLLLSIIGYGADYSARYWLELAPDWRRGAVALHVLGIATCLLVALRANEPRQRRLAWVLLAVLPLQGLFVLALRPVTPYWMLWALLPAFALLLALGLRKLLQNGLGRSVAVALLVFWCAWSIAVHRVLADPPVSQLLPVVRAGQHGLMDAIQHLTGAQRHTILLLPLRDRYAITAPLCEPVTLYAHYAEFVDQSLGTGLMQRCGRKEQVQIGGPAQGRALIGLRDYAWQQIDATPAHSIAHLGYSPVAAIWHAGPPSPPAVPGMFPAHPNLPVAPREFVVRGRSAPGELVVVAHRAAFHEPFELRSASVAGSAATPLYLDHMTAVLRTPRDSGDALDWELRIFATPDHVDVVTVAGSANTGR